MTGPNVLVFVRRSGLIVAGKRITAAKLQFGELVHHLEVIDKQKLIDHCQSFFAEQSLSGKRVLLVLDQDVVFEKKIPLKSDVQASLQQYIAAMPFDAGKRVAFSVTVDDHIQLCATNFELYAAIMQALMAVDAKPLHVTPLTLYGLEAGQQLKDVVSKLLRDTTVRRQADFMHCQPS